MSADEQALWQAAARDDVDTVGQLVTQGPALSVFQLCEIWAVLLETLCQQAFSCFLHFLWMFMVISAGRVHSIQ